MTKCHFATANALAVDIRHHKKETNIPHEPPGEAQLCFDDVLLRAEGPSIIIGLDSTTKCMGNINDKGFVKTKPGECEQQYPGEL